MNVKLIPKLIDLRYRVEENKDITIESDCHHRMKIDCNRILISQITIKGLRSLAWNFQEFLFICQAIENKRLMSKKFKAKQLLRSLDIGWKHFDSSQRYNVRGI